MTALRLCAIMKTDIGSSTPRFRALIEADFSEFLAAHRALISRLVAAHDGNIVKGEGDGFWIAFPSVTAAALAAMAIQDEMRHTQANAGDDRAALRIVITLGDVLYEEGDFFGDAVTLAARIESITPADDIYISTAARLAVNQAEIRTTLVDAFSLKGFPGPVPVYRVEQTHRTRIIADQYIVWTDLLGFARFLTGNSPMGEVERILDRLMELVGEVCREFGGINRFSAGDAHCLTFTKADQAIAAIERLVREWDRFDRDSRLGCALKAALHKGSLYLFRSYVYSSDINIVASVIDADRSHRETSALVTGRVQRELAGTAWDRQLRPIGTDPTQRRLAGIEIFRLEPGQPRPT